MKRMFKTEFLKEDLGLPYCGDVVHRQILNKSRWSFHAEIVFKHEGKFYRATFSEGATEMQDEYPWEYMDEVECTEVQQVEKLVKVWEPVPEESCPHSST